MPEEYNRIWIEKAFKRIPVPYPVVSIIIAGIIYSTYLFFSTKVTYFPWDFYHSLEISALSILIGFQLTGIQYLLDDMRKTFVNLKLDTDGRNINNLIISLEQKFYKSRQYYAIIVAVIVPKMTIELTRVLKGGATYYIAEGSAWSLLLDIFNYSMVYLMIFLMALILWVIYNVASTLNEMGSDPAKCQIRIDIFNIDKIGGLKPLRDFIMKVHTFFFICITLAIIFFINPFSVLSYNSFFLMILLLISVGFFFTGLRAIRKIFRGVLEDEINRINEKYQQERKKLMELVSKEGYKDKGDELNLVSTALETLYTERERMLQLHSSARGYDLTTIIEFTSSFILPLAAYLEKLYDIGIEIEKFL